MSRLGRRHFLIATGALLAASSSLLGQQPGRTYRIGSVYVARAAITQPFEDAFLARLRELGFETGRNLIYDVRHCDGDQSRLPAAVEEVMALKPDLLAAIEQVAIVMKSKTSTIPIVLTNSSDPVAIGLARSLARPGGNVTGIANLNEVLAAKQVEMFSEILPRMTSAALLLDAGLPAAANIERHVREAAAVRRATIVTYAVKDRAGLERAFADMERNRPDAVIAGGGSGLLFGNRRFSVESALRLGLPYSSGSAEGTADGGLFSYGSNLRATFRAAGSIAARLLKGANPAEMPVEQPTVFELVINLKTAKALGIKVPQLLLVRADRVIE